MLGHIAIYNLAIIERLEVEFAAGLTAITGETGAGKSIVIDALLLALGARAQSKLIGHHDTWCSVSAEFHLAKDHPVHAWLSEHDLTADGACLVRRRLDASGHNRCYINDAPVTLNKLAVLGAMLVRIHSQHAQQELLTLPAQHRLLDAYADTANERAILRAAYNDYQDIVRRLNALTDMDEADVAFLRAQAAELAAFNPGENEWEKMNREHKALAQHTDVARIADAILTRISEADTAMVRELGAFEQQLAPYRETFKLAEPLQALETAASQLNEAARALTALTQKEYDEAAYAELDARLSAWYDLARKHQTTPERLFEHMEALTARLADMEGLADEREALAAKKTTAHTAWQAAALVLSDKRRAAIPTLVAALTTEIQRLDMKHAAIAIDMDTHADIAPNAQGVDDIQCQWVANPGMPAKPLHTIISGGELSRLALAIAVVEAAEPTLIFDEADVGIGGKTAEIVGELLHRLGARHQVVSITHNAQVAAIADGHMQVHKTSDGATTTTRMVALDKPTRITELARMMGGVEESQTVAQYAAELYAKHHG